MPSCTALRGSAGGGFGRPKMSPQPARQVAATTQPTTPRHIAGLYGELSQRSNEPDDSAAQASIPSHGHAGDLDGRRRHGVTQAEVVADDLDAVVHRQQVAGDGDLLNRVG